jgi:hypothetical protein
MIRTMFLEKSCVIDKWLSLSWWTCVSIPLISSRAGALIAILSQQDGGSKEDACSIHQSRYAHDVNECLNWCRYLKCLQSRVKLGPAPRRSFIFGGCNRSTQTRTSVIRIHLGSKPAIVFSDHFVLRGPSTYPRSVPANPLWKRYQLLTAFQKCNLQNSVYTIQYRQAFENIASNARLQSIERYNLNDSPTSWELHNTYHSSIYFTITAKNSALLQLWLSLGDEIKDRISVQPSRPLFFLLAASFLIGCLRETGVDRLECKCLQIGGNELHEYSRCILLFDEEGGAVLFLEQSEEGKNALKGDVCTFQLSWEGGLVRIAAIDRELRIFACLPARKYKVMRTPTNSCSDGSEWAGAFHVDRKYGMLIVGLFALNCQFVSFWTALNSRIRKGFAFNLKRRSLNPIIGKMSVYLRDAKAIRKIDGLA